MLLPAAVELDHPALWIGEPRVFLVIARADGIALVPRGDAFE
jgi:hypothetical protein